MENLQVLSCWLTPVLLAIIAWYLKRFFERNEKQHDEFFNEDKAHDSRITRLETRVDHVEEDIHIIKSTISETHHHGNDHTAWE